jgi:hypothetical protein
VITYQILCFILLVGWLFHAWFINKLSRDLTELQTRTVLQGRTIADLLKIDESRTKTFEALGRTNEAAVGAIQALAARIRNLEAR